MRKAARTLLIIALTLAICLSGYELWKISEQYILEARIKDEMAKFIPEAEDAESDEPAQEAAVEAKGNPWVADMQTDVNSDIVGWLKIPETQIDYPFVLAGDNNYYLRRNLYGKYAAAGSIFMDYRCKEDLTSFNTVIYGHYMKNNSMFGSLSFFADEWFFKSNSAGTISLKDDTYSLEIFAYMVVHAEDEVIYSIDAEESKFFDYVKKNARNYREPTTRGNVVTLSTCTYEFDDARIVLLAIASPS
ncbi:MAG: class B sortase [Clostridiales bacterium]|nr:class B sortase [Clostridiales bacterium]